MATVRSSLTSQSAPTPRQSHWNVPWASLRQRCSTSVVSCSFLPSVRRMAWRIPGSDRRSVAARWTHDPMAVPPPFRRRASAFLASAAGRPGGDGQGGTLRVDDLRTVVAGDEGEPGAFREAVDERGGGGLRLVQLGAVHRPGDVDDGHLGPTRLADPRHDGSGRRSGTLGRHRQDGVHGAGGLGQVLVLVAVQPERRHGAPSSSVGPGRSAGPASATATVTLSPPPRPRAADTSVRATVRGDGSGASATRSASASAAPK